MERIEEVRQALETLGLPPLVTRDEVKRRYRELARRYHPDREGGDARRMEALNRAYEVLRAYMDGFRFRFDEEELARNCPESQHERQFKP